MSYRCRAVAVVAPLPQHAVVFCGVQGFVVTHACAVPGRTVHFAAVHVHVRVCVCVCVCVCVFRESRVVAARGRSLF